RRAFHVHADRCVLLELRAVDRTVGLDINLCAPPVKGSGEESEGICLQEGFTAGNADIRRVDAPDLLEDRIHAHGNPPAAGLFRIAPGTVKIAAGKTDEKTWPALVLSLSLEAHKDISDLHREALIMCRASSAPHTRSGIPRPGSGTRSHRSPAFYRSRTDRSG